MPHSPMSTSPPKSLSHVNIPILDVKEVMPSPPMNGFIKTISPMKLVPLIKQKDIQTVLAVQLKSNVKIVPQEKDVGPKKMLPSMELMNMEKLVVKKI